MPMNIRYWMGIRQLLCSHLSVLNKDVPSPLCCSPFTSKTLIAFADGVKGTLTGTPNFPVTHMLFADDLSLMSNDPDHTDHVEQSMSVRTKTSHCPYTKV